MSEWAEVRLGSVLRQTSRPVKVAEIEEVPFAGARWYAEGIYARLVEHASKVKTKVLNRIMTDDITYNRMWATKAAFGVVGVEANGCLVTNDFPIFLADRTRLLPEYMRLIFQTSTFQADAAVRAVGTTERRRLKEPDFLDITILLPSIAEQRRIVEVMMSVDVQIQRLRDEVASSRQVTSALSIELLQPRPHWESITIGEVARAATGRAFPDRFQGVSSGILPYFKVSDMGAAGNEREMRVSSNWLTEETMRQVNPRVCPAGTVVFPIIGAALLTEKRRILVQPSAFDQNVMGLILGDRITTSFMFAVMSNLRLRDLSQTGAVPSVNQTLISSIRFTLPPLAEQIEIGEQLDSLYLVTEAAEAEIARICSFRSTLLTALLSQEVEILESFDNLLKAVS